MTCECGTPLGYVVVVISAIMLGGTVDAAASPTTPPVPNAPAFHSPAAGSLTPCLRPQPWRARRGEQVTTTHLRFDVSICDEDAVPPRASGG